MAATEQITPELEISDDEQLVRDIERVGFERLTDGTVPEGSEQWAKLATSWLLARADLNS